MSVVVFSSFIKREREHNLEQGRRLDVGERKVVEIARRLTRLETEVEVAERRGRKQG